MVVRMKYLFLIGLSLFVGSCLAVARSSEPIADPEADYVNTPQEVCAEFGILKKSRVLRLELDLDGQGQPVIFLTFDGAGSKSGPVWTAYLPEASGYIRTDGIQFREEFVRAGKVPELNPSGGLLVLYPGKGAGNLVRYPLSGGLIQQQEELRRLDYNKPQDQELFEHIFKRKLDRPIPNEYFANPPHRVIDVKEIMDRVSPQRHQAAPTERPPIVATISDPPSMPASPQSRAVEIQPAAQAKDQATSRKPLLRTWIIGGILLIGVAGGVWVSWVQAKKSHH